MRTVEMRRSLDDPRLREAVAEQLQKPADSAEVSEAIELSVMVRTFHNLEQAGALPRGATMSTELSEAQQQRMRTVMDGNERLKGLDTPTSYEAALRVLVTDHDGNRKLDIDVNHLAASGLLEGSFEAAALEEILQRNADTPIDHQRISGRGDTFLQRQIDSETFRSTDYGSKSNIVYTLSDRSRAVQAGLRRTTLEDRNARAFSAQLAEVTTTLRSDPEAGVAQGLELARGLAAEHPRRAERLVTRMLQNTAEPSPARDALIEGLRGFPGEGLNLVVGETDTGNSYYRLRNPDGSVVRGRPPEGDIAITNDGLTQSLEVGDFAVSYADMADAMARRSALIREMGLTSEPSIGQMRDYLAQYAQGKDTNAVADKVGELLDAFCVHCGYGTEYGEHAGDAEAIHDRAPQDALGRNIIDCDGFAYTARELVSGIRDASGAPRFSTYVADTIQITGTSFGQQVGTGFHALLTVRDRQSGDLFVVNNQKTAARRYGVTDTSTRGMAVATYLALDEQGYSGDAHLRLRLSTDALFQQSATPYDEANSYTLMATPEERRASRETR